jgi:hypothetical protein
MGRKFSMHRDCNNETILIINTKHKKPLSRTKRRWKHNIKTHRRLVQESETGFILFRMGSNERGFVNHGN